MQHLGANDLLGLPRLVLFQAFTDADNRAQGVTKRRLRFFIDHFVRFTKVGAPLRVAENYGAAQFAYHRWSDLAGEGSRLLVVHILCA